MSKNSKLLVIIVDQLRADCITGALAAHVNLPNLAAFRKEAVTFTNHFSVMNPCGPSRASIFTGCYAMNHRSIRNGAPLAHGIPNVATELRKTGYDPMLFGYSDTSLDPSQYHPNDPKLTTEEELLPGLREVVEMRLMQSFPWRAYLKEKGYALPDYSDFYNQVSPDTSRAPVLTDPPFYKAKDSDTAFLTDALLRHLSVRTDQDWAAFLTYIRPHPPLVAPEPYNKMYAPADLPLPQRQKIDAEIAAHPFFKGAINPTSMATVASGFDGDLDPNNDNDVSGLRALYLGLATEVDDHFGRIIAFLKETGQYNNTRIVFTADHGEMLGDHHQWGKQTPYDQAYRVPLIIHDPENTASFGTNVDSFTESVDVMPTILDMNSQRIPAGVDGCSLLPFLRGETPANWRDYVHLELDFSEPHKPTKWQVALGTDTNDSNLSILRESRFKLVHFNGGLAPLLFDLENDPFEMINLAEKPEHAATLLRLTQKLLNHKMRHANRSLTGVKITSEGAWNYHA